MRKFLNKKSGFTLIELMIVVAILGILAAIAIPAFVTYVRRSKSVEATENIDKMFAGAASYYENGDRQERGLAGSLLAHCIVASANDTKTPTADKTGTLNLYKGNSFETLGFMIGPSYYRYEITSPGASCNNSRNQEFYAMTAYGDLDGDGTRSTFEQAAGSNPENELYRSKGFYIANETE